MTLVAKMIDGRMVEVICTTKTVGFSAEEDWILICFDFEKINSKREIFKWVPASTRFDWVREFMFG
jgi:hypothetical protein